jgi:hypothetical protein
MDVMRRGRADHHALQFQNILKRDQEDVPFSGENEEQIKVRRFIALHAAVGPAPLEAMPLTVS